MNLRKNCHSKKKNKSTIYNPYRRRSNGLIRVAVVHKTRDGRLYYTHRWTNPNAL